MPGDNPDRSPIKFRQKALLAALGILLFIGLLEIILRLGGFIYQVSQEQRNLSSIRQRGEYRIMCLGESTTAGGEDSYPAQLEAILNQRNIGIKFSVINKGVTGTNSSLILSRLEENLDKYKPDIVIAMMGSNDWNIKYYEDIPEANTVVFKNFRAYKFVRILWMHLNNKIKGKGEPGPAKKSKNRLPGLSFFGSSVRQCYAADDPVKAHTEESKRFMQWGRYFKKAGEFSQAKENFRKSLYLAPANSVAYTELGWCEFMLKDLDAAEEMFKQAIALDAEDCFAYQGLGAVYRSQGKLLKSEEMFKRVLEVNKCSSAIIYKELGCLYQERNELRKAEDYLGKAVKLDPDDSQVYFNLGVLYEKQGKCSESEEMFKKAIKINPRNNKAYIFLGNLYLAQGKYHQAESLLKKALELGEEIEDVYVSLGLCYRQQAKDAKAEEMYKQALCANPGIGNAYYALGDIYCSQEKPEAAEKMWKETIRLDPHHDSVYISLGQLYVSQKRFSEAEEIFKEAARRSPKDGRAYLSLMTLYREKGDQKKMREYRRLLDESKILVPITRQNYQTLKRVLDERGVRLVCMQYPMRSIEPLKSIFFEQDGVIFVDNEKNFKSAIKKHGYKELFADMFAGDFGHCTYKGNRLIAQNVAGAILKECFNQ